MTDLTDNNIKKLEFGLLKELMSAKCSRVLNTHERMLADLHDGCGLVIWLRRTTDKHHQRLRRG